MSVVIGEKISISFTSREKREILNFLNRNKLSPREIFNNGLESLGFKPEESTWNPEPAPVEVEHYIPRPVQPQIQSTSTVTQQEFPTPAMAKGVSGKAFAAVKNSKIVQLIAFRAKQVSEEDALKACGKKRWCAAAREKMEELEHQAEKMARVNAIQKLAPLGDVYEGICISTKGTFAGTKVQS